MQIEQLIRDRGLAFVFEAGEFFLDSTGCRITEDSAVVGFAPIITRDAKAERNDQHIERGRYDRANKWVPDTVQEGQVRRQIRRIKR